jgi:hypothetical protein
MSLRRSLLVTLFLVVALAACDSGSGEATTTAGGAATTAAPTTAADTTTTTPATTLPPGTEELPEEIRQELAELITITESVRELEFREQPKVAVVSADELAERVREQLEEDLADLPADQALYRLLGLIEPDVDLARLYTDLYSEQVAGFYDGEAGELVVPRAEDGFTVLQRATLVHELTHALTDQHYDFHAGYSDMLDNDRYDEASALQALIEGDAVLAELLYLRSLSSEEQAEFFTESFGVDSAQFDAAPRFIRDALVFPYDSGFLFVDRLYRTGGFEAVAAAYADPPSSTEQIIDPADYPADQPIVVDLDLPPLEGFELEYQSTWGELGFTLMFDQALGESPSDVAAGGWGGDSYQVLYDGTEVVLILRYRGDSAADTEEMRVALNDYVGAAMGMAEAEELEGGSAYAGDDHAWVWSDGSEVLFVATTSEAAFASAVEAVAPVPDTTVTTDGG